MAVIVYEYHPLGGGNGGWDSYIFPVAIYKNIREAKKAINRRGCTIFLHGQWTREPKKGELLSQVISYEISKPLPFNKLPGIDPPITPEQAGQIEVDSWKI